MNSMHVHAPGLPVVGQVARLAQGQGMVAPEVVPRPILVSSDDGDDIFLLLDPDLP